ncbi:MAG: Flp pilus assembly complex ATPase component TadA [Solobacterium sp.]|jgi:type IV pilus assembly protein PilB|nr:Flp pilus assembly complex ATPase component TadA [Solobacterium sp.]MCH4204861.1 Flp pilus assembly complex ATPase component TadA [Solobacterium sp.]MCH4226485.1 Flp pilus assembly complex ATPase component TadA [Solobacterium sp.]MCH4283049.1 Flp pilus assembly complex ATPase component TadA [Solobacterium sp.]
MQYRRLGEILQDAGVLSEEDLNRALSIQKTSGKRLGTVLIENKFITEMQLIDTLKMQLGIDFEDLNNEKIDPSMAKYIPKNIAKQYRIVPVKVQGDRLWIAMEDPLNFRAIEAAKEVSKKRVTPMIAYSDAVGRALSVLYENEGAALAIEQMQEERGVTVAEAAEDAQAANDGAAAPTVKLVNSILERGVAEKASDIHVEPREHEMVVRIRVDGRLTQVLTIPKELQAAVISRFKVMSNMNITERRVPQDGRAVVRRPDGTNVDLRLSTLPTIYGEKVVIRILSRDQKTLTRQGIGITERDNAKFDRILENSAGMILIVGPTGSGKTSTLYTMIQELKSDTVNMISLEDPVEFQIDGVTQVAINEKVGLTFASALRACLRQDPDIICVGEIRDGETAQIAMQAAMTGHLVLSTIHTEDAISAIDRLKDLGVEPYLIGGSVRGIVSQRLLRRICPNCKEEIVPSAHMLDIAGIKDPSKYHFYHGKGCHMCFGTGYRGRTGVFEILTMNSKLRDAITAGLSSTELRKVVNESGDFVPMIANARDLVAKGITTLDEAVREVATIE